MEQTQVVAKQQMTNVKVLPWPLAAGIPQFPPAAVPCGPGGPAPAYTCAQAENHCVDTLTCVHVYCTYYIYRRAKTAANTYSSGGRYMDVVTPQNMWQTYGCGDPTDFVSLNIFLINSTSYCNSQTCMLVSGSAHFSMRTGSGNVCLCQRPNYVCRSEIWRGINKLLP